MRIHELSVVKMVNGMVTLQELYGTMGNNIQKKHISMWEVSMRSYKHIF